MARAAFRILTSALKDLSRTSEATLSAHGLSIFSLAPASLSRVALSGRHYAASFSSFASGLDLTLPSRRNKFDDLGLVNLLLPNRQAFASHFSPHGISLVPRAAWGSATSEVELPNLNHLFGGPFALQLSPDGDEASELHGALQAIGIRTWRRLKMRKHKIQKRRKAARFKKT